MRPHVLTNATIAAPDTGGSVQATGRLARRACHQAGDAAAAGHAAPGSSTVKVVPAAADEEKSTVPPR